MAYETLKGISDYVSYGPVTQPEQPSATGAVTTAGASSIIIPAGIGAVVLMALYAMFGSKKKKRKARRSYA